MKENNNGFIDVFGKMDDERNKLEGLVSMLFAVEDAFMYGANDPQGYISAISLIGNMLNDYNKTHRELIDEGYQILESKKIKYNSKGDK